MVFVRTLLLGWISLGLLLCAADASAQNNRRDRDRDSGQTDVQRNEDPRDQRSSRVVPRPPERIDHWILGVRVTYDDTGALIIHVADDSAAWDAGLERRDQIITVDGYQVGNVNDQLYTLERELNLRADRRGNVRLLVMNHRNRRLMNIDVRLRRTGRPDNPDPPQRPTRQGVIGGTVASRLSGQLPRNAVLAVSLVDVSSRISTLRPLAQTTIRDPGPFPVPFELQYDANQIEAGHEYALRAVLTVNGLLAQRTREDQIVEFGPRPLRYQLMLDRGR